MRDLRKARTVKKRKANIKAQPTRGHRTDEYVIAAWSSEVDRELEEVEKENEMADENITSTSENIIEIPPAPLSAITGNARLRHAPARYSARLAGAKQGKERGKEN